MRILTHTTDDKARLVLPKSFANSTVLVEQVSETELRIRKARVIPEDDLPFVEEAMGALSDRDRDIFLALLENPPPPNDALQSLLAAEDGRREADRGEADRDNCDQLDGSFDLVSLSWPQFFARVMTEQHPPGHALMRERLQMLRQIRNLFVKKVHFRDLEYPGRRKIAGLFKSANPNFLLFGSMQWVGFFKQAIKDNNEGVSLALDEIPLHGDISQDQFQRFAERFLSAFERSGMALASRMLAMKRPDTFVCVNNQNRDGLIQAFGVSPNRDAESYWNLITKIRTCTWWQAPEPTAGDERDVWKARAAFLDALFFTGAAIE